MALEPLATADVSDAAPVRVAMDARIRPLWHGARVAGTAFTVQTPPGQFLAVQDGANRAQPGDVIVVDGGGQVDCALWGDKMSRLAQSRGIAGFVVDGAVRDVTEIETLGFPVFGITSVPTAPARETPGETGVPIGCGGLEVRPGDIVYGDADGVVVVPRELHEEVRARVGAT
jgi:RraA family protein